MDVIYERNGGFAPVSSNKIRVTDNATGIFAECGEHRSQHANRAAALAKLELMLASPPHFKMTTPQTAPAPAWSDVISDGGMDPRNAPVPVVMVGERIDLIQQLRGRAAYLRTKGSVKTVGLLEDAADTLATLPAQAAPVGFDNCVNESENFPCRDWCRKPECRSDRTTPTQPAAQPAGVRMLTQREVHGIAMECVDSSFAVLCVTENVQRKFIEVNNLTVKP